MVKKKKKKTKKKCCRKFIKKTKHCSKCPGVPDTELKEIILKKAGKKKQKKKE